MKSPWFCLVIILPFMAFKVMPIQVQTQIKVFTQEEYHALNRQVLRVIFDVQNDFGRFLDEELAKREIAARCTEIGIAPVEREVRIRVTHERFVKDYSMDLLLASGLMIEAKARESTAPAHRAQALNYLLLAGMQHGTLVNLRTERVQHEFVSTQLTPERRRQFTVADTQWRDPGPESAFLKLQMLDLLHDWGAFLEVSLYRDALTFFLGGAAVVQKSVEVFSGARSLGNQTLHLLTPDTAFAVSAVTEEPEQFGMHLTRFLRHTRLRHLQWINLNHHSIEFQTLLNSP
jgi:GxxExxY protein